MGTSDNTAVDAICNYGNGSQVPQLDQVKVYQELRSMTNGITKLGIYKLDNKSLYINGKCMILSFLLSLEQFGTTVSLRKHFS